MDFMGVTDILNKKDLTRQDLITLLQSEGEDLKQLFDHARRVREDHFGRRVYYRAIVEFSNICRKDCLYCGIRRSNNHVDRYDLSDDQILRAASFAFDNGIYSLVLQSGERTDRAFVLRVGSLVRKIKQMTGGKMGITLSVGEQDYEVYKYWYEMGAHRYLLRIEVSDPRLYPLYHPWDDLHRYERRLECLYFLKDIGYQVGTGVMIGLPMQTVENLADDLLFFKRFDIDMLGMGPYIEHHQTPLYSYRHLLLPLRERYMLTMKMNALLRILMPDINIAATTALQAIDKMGREKALDFACNVIMPNVTPVHRGDYLLYEGKPCTDEGGDACVTCLNKRLEMYNLQPVMADWGDSPHSFRRIAAGIKKTQAE